ncbi:hypothetical protein KEM52_003861, partial [Ascosphaera acerosa]
MEKRVERPASKEIVKTRKAIPKAVASHKLARELKNSFDVRDVLGRMLSSDISISLREALGMSPKLHKAFFTSLPAPMSSQPEAHEASVKKVRAFVRNRMIKSAPLKSLKMYDGGDTVYVFTTLKHVFVGEVEVRAIIDTGAE